MEANAESFKLLFLGSKRKVQCYNMYFINKYIFYTKEYEEGRNIYNIEVCIKRSIFNKFEVDYYDKLVDVIELQ
jgi:hypothetical protein